MEPAGARQLTRDWNETSERQKSDAFGAGLYSATLEADHHVVEAVARIAVQRGVPRAQIALAWVMGTFAVTAPIVGASKPHHIDDAIAALDIALSTEERSALEAPYVPRAIVGLD